MKKLLLLPGNSPKNKLWAESMAFYYESLFDATYVQNYDHWENGNDTINFDVEAQKLQNIVQDDVDTKYVIFAKSFGSILALYAIYKGFIIPEKCVFFGLPFNLVAEQNIFKDDWSFLENFAVSAIAFHNTHDPVADYNFTVSKLSEYNATSIQLLSMEGNTHGYNFPELYDVQIKSFLEK